MHPPLTNRGVVKLAGQAVMPTERQRLVTALRDFLTSWGLQDRVDVEEITVLARKIASVANYETLEFISEELSKKSIHNVSEVFLDALGPLDSPVKAPTKQEWDVLLKAAEEQQFAPFQDEFERLTQRQEKYSTLTGNSSELVARYARLAKVLLTPESSKDVTIAVSMAEHLIREALRWNPDSPELWKWWTICYLSVGDRTNAEWILWERIRRYPTDTSAWNKLISVLSLDNDRAREHKDLVTRLFNNRPDHLGFAISYSNLLRTIDPVDKIRADEILFDFALNTKPSSRTFDIVISQLIKNKAIDKDSLFGGAYSSYIYTLIKKSEMAAGKIANALISLRNFDSARSIALHSINVRADRDSVSLMVIAASANISLGGDENLKSARDLLRRAWHLSSDKEYIWFQYIRLMVWSDDVKMQKIGYRFYGRISALTRRGEKIRAMMQAAEDYRNQLGNPEGDISINDEIAIEVNNSEPILPDIQDYIEISGRARRVKFLIESGVGHLRNLGKKELEQLANSSPGNAYVRLLSLRYGVDIVQGRPSFATSIEQALSEKDLDTVRQLELSYPPLSALTLVVRALLGDPEAAVEVIELVRVYKSDLHPASKILVRSLRPMLRDSPSNVTAVDFIFKNRRAVTVELRNAIDSMATPYALAA